MAYLDELVVSMHRQRGIYALLLGSGISRAAGVPTGWDVTLDLARQLAVTQGDPPEDLEAWYRETYAKEPDYSELLEQIAGTEAERRGLLESYFEPDEREREQGLKLPTAAHKAIAKLVAKGHVRVILTTNFDRLLEQALIDEGVQPVTVSSSDAIRGAPPYVHTSVIIVKLHGDYKDTRIKNSVAELAAYDEALNRYLDRILDEFGLVVAGWSGDWDAAWRAAISRMPNRRYSMYWLAYSAPSAAAQQLIDFRRGRVVSGLGADAFFGGLVAKLEALEEATWLPPQSTDLLLAEVKRYMAESERFGIRLEDLILDEAKELAKVMQNDSGLCPWALYPEQVEVGRQCVEYLELRAERLTRILRTVLRYDKTGRWTTTITRAVSLLAVEPRPNGQVTNVGRSIRLYPLRLIITALCVITAQEGRIQVLKEIAGVLFRRWSNEEPLIAALFSLDYADDVVKRFSGTEWFHPFAMRASDVLPGWLQPMLISEYPYYDQGEFLLSLAAMADGIVGQGRYWPPLGGRYMHYGGNAVEKLIKNNPAWFRELFPNFDATAASFDESMEGDRKGFRAIRLVPLLE